MYENTGAARARDGRRADRRRASTSTPSTGGCTRASRRASSSCWRAGSANVQRYDGGLLTVTHLTLEDYRSTGADESYSEGVVDHLRSVEGTAVAGARPRPARRRRPPSARSRCAPPTTASTSRASPAPRAAAATAGRRASRPTWTSPSSSSSCAASSAEQLLSTTASSSSTSRRAMTSHDVVAQRGGGSAAASRSATRARWIRSPPGCCSCWSAARRACSAS